MRKKGRLGYNMTERATGNSVCKEHLARFISHLFNSVLYKPRYMHIWLHWRCPLLTESFACHSSPRMTLVLGTLIPFVFFFFNMSMYGHLAISDHILMSCRCMHVYCALAQARPTMPCICLVLKCSRFQPM